ncbi:MAG: antitoxin [Actinomycetota bacterium]
MGLMDRIRGLLKGNADKAKDAVEKAGDMIDDKTDGKFADKVDMAQEKAEDLIDNEAESEEG